MKRTAVEWLIDELMPSIALQTKYIEELKEQAKEMEKQQKMDFANWCRIHDNKYPLHIWTIQQLFDKYIAETHGSKGSAVAKRLKEEMPQHIADTVDAYAEKIAYLEKFIIDEQLKNKS